MLDMGFAQDIEHIAGETRWRKQTLLFSATLEGDAIQDFAERLLEDPVEVSANPPPVSAKRSISGITAPMILSIKPRCWCTC